MLPKLSEAKVKNGIFIGSQIKEMLASIELEGKMNPIQKSAWKGSRLVVNGFWETKSPRTLRSLSRT